MKASLFGYLIGVLAITAGSLQNFAAVASLQQEGNAMADIARAMPGLTASRGIVYHVGCLAYYLHLCDACLLLYGSLHYAPHLNYLAFDLS